VIPIGGAPSCHGNRDRRDKPGDDGDWWVLYAVFVTAIKHTIEVDDLTARALETRAAEAGLSVAELLAKWAAPHTESDEIPAAEIAELDRQWAAIKAGEPTVPHQHVVRWLDTWGTPGFRP